MFKKIMSMLFLMGSFTLVSCTNSNSQDANDPNPTTYTREIEISNLLADNILTLPDPVPVLATTDSVKEATVVLTVKNSGTATKNLSIALSPSSGFSIKVNRCGATLAKNASCQVTIAFSNRGLYDATYNTSLDINGSQLQLSASVSGLPSPNSGVATLSVELSEGFVPPTSSTYRTLTIKNLGPAYAKDLNVQIPTGYTLRLNRCPSLLKVNESCTMQIALEQIRSTDTPPSASIVVSASNQTQSSQLNTQSGAIVPSSFTVTIASLTGGSISGVTSGQSVNSGNQITITAVPSLNFNFSQWTQGASSCGTNPTCTLTITQNITIGASFVAPPYELLAKSNRILSETSNLIKIDNNNYLFGNSSSGTTIKLDINGSDTLVSSSVSINAGMSSYLPVRMGSKIYSSGVILPEIYQEPVVYDIETNSLSLVKNIVTNTNVLSSSPRNWVSFMGSLFFRAIIDNGSLDLFKSDGTENGTVPFGISNEPSHLLWADSSRMFFSQGNTTYVSTDGISATPIMSGIPLIDDAGNMTVFNLGSDYYFIKGGALLKYNGSSVTTVSDMTSSSISYQSYAKGSTIAYLQARNFISNKIEIYKLENGIVSFVAGGFEINNLLYFRRNSSSYINNGQMFYVNGNQLYFNVQIGSTFQIWTSDGTPQGTYRISPLENTYSYTYSFYKSETGSLFFKSNGWGSSPSCNKLFKVQGDLITQIIDFPNNTINTNCQNNLDFFVFQDDSWVMINGQNNLYKLNF